jgi:hypothetical protein
MSISHFDNMTPDSESQPDPLRIGTSFPVRNAVRLFRRLLIFEPFGYSEHTDWGSAAAIDAMWRKVPLVLNIIERGAAWWRSVTEGCSGCLAHKWTHRFFKGGVVS